MAGENSANLAILIDADNVSYRVIAGVMAEVSKYGTAYVRRIYGDWTSSNMVGWRRCLLEYSITPIQHFAYTTGKNATDGAMIIDAMDLLYSGRFDGFCLISSDSDFTRLAQRIREQGITVYGFGKKTTNNAFVVACTKFFWFETLSMPAEEATPAALPELSRLGSNATAPQQRSTGATMLPPPEPTGSVTTSTSLPLRPSPTANVQPTNRPLNQFALNGMRAAIENSKSYEDEWVNLADVGLMLQRISPALNAKNFGLERLADFLEASGIVDSRKKRMDPHPPIALVRLKHGQRELHATL